jgi:hypothetical protein
MEEKERCYSFILSRTPHYKIEYVNGKMVLTFSPGAAFELVEEAVDLVDLAAQAAQLRVGWVTLGQQFLRVFVERSADRLALFRSHRHELHTYTIVRLQTRLARLVRLQTR